MVAQPKCVGKPDTQLSQRDMIDSGELPSEWHAFPVKLLPARTAKYEVDLREGSVQAVHAMHTILSRMVLFTCNECKERFPDFHPAYVPPPSIANEMEVLKHGRDGLATCNVEVSEWDELPPFEAHDGPATRCSGRGGVLRHL